VTAAGRGSLGGPVFFFFTVVHVFYPLHFLVSSLLENGGFVPLFRDPRNSGLCMRPCDRPTIPQSAALCHATLPLVLPLSGCPPPPRLKQLAPSLPSSFTFPSFLVVYVADPSKMSDPPIGSFFELRTRFFQFLQSFYRRPSLDKKTLFSFYPPAEFLSRQSLPTPLSLVAGHPLQD